jgi:hypothetical protein
VLALGVADRSAVPTLATLEHVSTDFSVLPRVLQRREEKQHRAALQTPGLFAAATLLDTRDWAVTRVRLWANAASVQGVAADAERFDVLRATGPALTQHANVPFET